MLQEITKTTLTQIKNPVFREYAAMYLDIYDSFQQDVENFGLPFHRGQEDEQETKALLTELKQLGVVSRCQDASLFYNRISPACEACKKGVGTMTSYLSFGCHRRCYFCFNPNQDNYEAFQNKKRDWEADLLRIKQEGGQLTHIALTGGEPLLYPDDTVAFFRRVTEYFPGAHRRLYTSGDLLTEPLLTQLQEAGLDEIRFSYKLEDSRDLQEKVLANMSLARTCIPSVMVEMPVMPDAEDAMKTLLNRLDEIGIYGINLLELCFPYHNAEAFRERGYELKNPPYRTLYNFWYAGGLPIAGSEKTALRLMRYAAQNHLRLGVHYCSLENKNFGQMYQQNHILAKGHPTMYFSNQDYYLKTVKAFGKDAVQVRQILTKAGRSNYIYDRENQFIQFHPDDAHLLSGRPLELAISVNVMEQREEGIHCRELKLLRADALSCQPQNL